MSPRSDNSGTDSNSLGERIRREELLDRFEAAWRNGARPDLGRFVADLSEPRPQGLLRELLRLDCHYRRQAGEQSVASDYAGLWPGGAEHIEAILAESAAGGAVQPQPASSAPPPKLHGDVESRFVGTQLGPNILLEKLGQGGMGAVYKARHQHLDKLVAIKVLPAQFTQNPEFVSRFRREMRAVGKIDHPHIVRAMDAGEIDGVHYLTMEYVDGRDLSQVIKEKGPLSVASACKAIRQAAQALAAAHQAGLIHRDVKPSNLLVSKSGQIKLLDLGLARLGEDAAAATELTAAGQSFGTPDYMAPEQWVDSHSADARADLYALGCTLSYLLTGRPPYGDDRHRHPLNKMSGHVSEPIPDLRTLRPNVPDGVVAIYQKLMAKNPDERYQSATELINALSAFTSAKSLPEAQSPRGVDPVVAHPTARTAVPGTTWLNAGTRGTADAVSVSALRGHRRSVRFGKQSVVAVILIGAALVAGTALISSNRRSPTTTPPDPAPSAVSPLANVETPDTLTTAPVSLSPPVPETSVLESDAFVLRTQSSRWPFDPNDGQTYVWSPPESLGPDVNSARDEMVWGLSADERTIYFARMRLFASHRISKLDPFSSPSPSNLVRFLDPSGTITPDGLILVGTKRGESSQESLWMSVRASHEDSFIEPVKLPPSINSEAPTLHPVMSPDGLTLLACSTRQGSESGDVWMFTRPSREEPFGSPERLPDPVNTPDWDMPASITNDRTFLIASTQRNDSGRLTRVFRYFTRHSAQDPFGPAQLVGLPLGAAADSDSISGYRLSADGLSLYFSAPSLEGGQQADLYVCHRVPETEVSPGADAGGQLVE